MLLCICVNTKYTLFMYIHIQSIHIIINDALWDAWCYKLLTLIIILPFSIIPFMLYPCISISCFKTIFYQSDVLVKIAGQHSNNFSGEPLYKADPLAYKIVSSIYICIKKS